MLKAENAYRTITEVADLLQVQASALRFWETQFSQIKPVKRVGRRYYRAEDVVLLARIRDFLYEEGFTIKGVQKRLKEEETPELALIPERKAATPTNTFLQEVTDIKNYLEDYL